MRVDSLRARAMIDVLEADHLDEGWKERLIGEIRTWDEEGLRYFLGEFHPDEIRPSARELAR